MSAQLSKNKLERSWHLSVRSLIKPLIRTAEKQASMVSSSKKYNFPSKIVRNFTRNSFSSLIFFSEFRISNLISHQEHSLCLRLTFRLITDEFGIDFQAYECVVFDRSNYEFDTYLLSLQWKAVGR